jgi:hypothetical protein
MQTATVAVTYRMRILHKAFGISAIRQAVGPHSWGNLDRRSMKLDTGVTIGPTTAHADFLSAIGCVNTRFHALKILTSGGRYQTKR